MIEGEGDVARHGQHIVTAPHTRFVLVRQCSTGCRDDGGFDDELLCESVVSSAVAASPSGRFRGSQSVLAGTFIPEHV